MAFIDASHGGRAFGLEHCFWFYNYKEGAPVLANYSVEAGQPEIDAGALSENLPRVRLRAGLHETGVISHDFHSQFSR